MPTSGFTIHDDCRKQLEQLKFGQEIKYIIFKINDDCDQVIVDQTGGPNKDYYERFISSLPSKEPRYAVLDLEFQVPEVEGARKKIIFYAWSPDESDVKAKMVHALNLRAFRRLFIGTSVHIQGADVSDFDIEKVTSKASSAVAEE
ncbi:hypothetical protein BDB00DRAFT_796212 [Zychaea mexicana]|uniref:uncharacterized protein n=1 Tax=Zychaea mexicana TaxID=64656 RepID=UPI0022FF0E5B|nr:uncharacterized protein BDB00DRAFT_796212 [Zychaea mexicana]KAI9499292.1 hypothetical protein BDB00DRAFT_796212 [Zychaea mexicana]